ncbi:NAD(P)-dependent oxidoreductase [Microlunatus sp. Y2014]|uniref:NAD(P)-dependent oxidoreductase n=1 Tax=Microlunatus sp. Y2014 TaxID=3418488 RepID=UPI003DA74AD5
MTTNNESQFYDLRDRPAVSVIGLGLMGRALAAALHAAGHRTTVWNRTSARADELVASGAVRAESPQVAMAAGPLVVICLTDDAAVREVLGGLAAGALAGKVVVNLTSSGSTQARELSAWLAERGATIVDGAIMTTPSGIGTPDGLVIYSGPRDVFDRYEETLHTLGGAPTFLGEDVGLASLYDLAQLTMMWSVFNGFLHGAALLATAGVDAAAFQPAATQTANITASWLPGMAAQVDAGDYADPDASLATHLGAMDHLLAESQELGISTKLPTLIKSLAERAAAHGSDGDGYALLIKEFRRPT